MGAPWGGNVDVHVLDALALSRGLCTQWTTQRCAVLPYRLNQSIILFIRLLHAGIAVQKGRGVSLPLLGAVRGMRGFTL